MTTGAMGAGRLGSAKSRADIERALRFWVRVQRLIHVPLFDLDLGTNE